MRTQFGIEQLAGGRIGKVQISQTYHYPAKSEFLVGGIASIVFGEAVFRLSGQGSDDRKLGRWSYFTISGKN